MKYQTYYERVYTQEHVVGSFFYDVEYEFKDHNYQSSGSAPSVSEAYAYIRDARAEFRNELKNRDSKTSDRIQSENSEPILTNL